MSQIALQESYRVGLVLRTTIFSGLPDLRKIVNGLGIRKQYDFE